MGEETGEGDRVGEETGEGDNGIIMRQTKGEWDRKRRNGEWVRKQMKGI